jgi:hypothetical protein
MDASSQACDARGLIRFQPPGHKLHRWQKLLSARNVPTTKRHLMKHATSATLDGLSELLEQIRAMAGLKEKKPGIFYRNSRSFLHFHEDPAGLFADLRVGDDFNRYPVNTRHQWRRLLLAIDRAINS